MSLISECFLVQAFFCASSDENAGLARAFEEHRVNYVASYVGMEENMVKNRVVIKERDAWSDLANFIGEMVAKYAEEIDLDNLPDPDIYLRGKWMKQLYREFYKEKNITKFRNAKNSVDRKNVA